MAKEILAFSIIDLDSNANSDYDFSDYNKKSIFSEVYLSISLHHIHL